MISPSQPTEIYLLFVDFPWNLTLPQHDMDELGKGPELIRGRMRDRHHA